MHLFTGNRMTFLQILEIPRKATAVEPYFITVAGLAILLKQDHTKSVFKKTFQNVQNK